MKLSKMKSWQKIPYIILALTSLFFFSATELASAIDCNSASLTPQQALQCGSNAGAGGGSRSPRSLESLIKSIVEILSAIAGVVAVIMLIVGGLRFITSGGSEAAIKSARATLLYALAGLIVVAFSQLIVHFVLANTK